MPSTSDAWANLEARDLLIDLADRGIDLAVVEGRLRVAPAEALTAADEAALRQHRADLLVLVLANDDRTLDRLAALQAGILVPGEPMRGRCPTCGEAHGEAKRIGPCGWCRLAEIQFADWQVTQAYAKTGAVPEALRLQAEAATLSRSRLALFPSVISGRPAVLFKDVA